MYGGDSPRDYIQKFERPYKPLLEQGVKFYAALGNHDKPNQRLYKLFNMNQSRYYAYTKGDVEFFVLDSTHMDPEQLRWLEKELQNSSFSWKICYFHHPPYSSGARHGSDTDLRVLLEPLFVQYGVNVVFSGHEHFYERLKPQKGVQYFISGSAARLRRGNIKATEIRAKGFDQDLSFMLVEISGDDLYFRVISRTGQTVDSGTFQRLIAKAALAASAAENRVCLSLSGVSKE
jgi:3',5'-cyclic AMP phosphodiesterase CpdA